MERQISLKCARYGFPVALYDVAEDVLANAEALDFPLSFFYQANFKWHSSYM